MQCMHILYIHILHILYMYICWCLIPVWSAILVTISHTIVWKLLIQRNNSGLKTNKNQLEYLHSITVKQWSSYGSTAVVLVHAPVFCVHFKMDFTHVLWFFFSADIKTTRITTRTLPTVRLMSLWFQSAVRLWNVQIGTTCIRFYRL